MSGASVDVLDNKANSMFFLLLLILTFFVGEVTIVFFPSFSFCLLSPPL